MYLIVIRKTLTTAFHGNGRPISCEGIACELVHNAYLMVSAVAYVGHGAIFEVVVGVANFLHLQTWQLTGIMVYKGYIYVCDCACVCLLRDLLTGGWSRPREVKLKYFPHMFVCYFCIVFFTFFPYHNNHSY